MRSLLVGSLLVGSLRMLPHKQNRDFTDTRLTPGVFLFVGEMINTGGAYGNNQRSEWNY